MRLKISLNKFKIKTKLQFTKNINYNCENPLKSNISVPHLQVTCSNQKQNYLRF